MKYAVLIIFFILTSCIVNSQKNTSFYERVKKEKEIYKDFLQHEGLREILETLDNEIFNSNKVIFISIYNENRSALFVYDNTNDNYFLTWKDFGEEKYSYKKFDKGNLDKVGETNLFMLKYVLENKIEELKKISEEAYDIFNAPQYEDIRIIDVENRKYDFNRIKAFEVYKGKPVMNEAEYLESMGIKENE